MKEYELIREIPNQCSGNQMRDVFFSEVSCESPLEYVKAQVAGKDVTFTEEELADGSVRVIADVEGLIHRYTFTPI